MNLIHVSVLLLSPSLLEALPWDRPARNQDWSSQVRLRFRFKVGKFFLKGTFTVTLRDIPLKKTGMPD